MVTGEILRFVPESAAHAKVLGMAVWAGGGGVVSCPTRSSGSLHTLVAHPAMDLLPLDFDVRKVWLGGSDTARYT